MKTSHLFVALVLAAALLLAGCGPKPAPPLAVPDEAQAGDLTALEACEYVPPGSKTTFDAECATVTVSENWDKAGSRLIALPLVRIRTDAATPAEPVFFLRGGPGAPNLSWDPPDWLLKNHDVVMVGYRGVEGTVVLDCPNLDPPYKAHVGRDIFSQETLTEYAQATRQCAADFAKAGIDLSGYSIPDVIEDMEAVRHGLGYERINLYTESYGTRLAQIYAYMHPDSLHRSVLLGVNFPGHFIWHPDDLDKLIEHMSDLCAQDPGCSSRTSDLAQDMHDVTHNMPARWLFFPIDEGTVRFGTHSLFFRNPQMAIVIDAYLAAARGDPSGLAMMNLMAKVMPAPRYLGDQFSKAMSADLEMYEGIESVSLGDSIIGAPFSQMVWPLASSWPMELIPEDLRNFQESDAEMLLVNGTLDFSTPHFGLDEARPYYPNAQIVLLPEFGHSPDLEALQKDALERLVTSYYDTGVGDDSLYVYQPLSFEVGTSFTVLAKVVVAAMIVVPLLLILVVALVVRRVRRRRVSVN